MDVDVDVDVEPGTGAERGAAVEVVAVGPHDEAAFRAWFDVLGGSEQHDRPGEPGELLHEQRALARAGGSPDADTGILLLAASRSGAVVGVARLELPRRDNLHLGEAVLAVSPDARRLGVGRALEAELVRRMAALGRTALVLFTDEPPGSAGRSAGRLFALALGYDVAQVEVRRDLDLPLPADKVAALQERCRPHAADYVVRTWQDRCPDDLLDDRAALSRAMSTDVPKDQLDWREEVWDAARLRRSEARTAEQDRTSVCAGAVHVPSGRLVAYTDLQVPRSEPRRAYQWDTVVLPAHRGRRLGLLVKLAALQELSACSPRTEVISTWNAQENTHMIAVNDALGARTNGVEVVLQKVLPAGP